MEIKVTPSGNYPFFFGRTLYDKEREAMFFNWTASGFTLRFLGDRLEMDVTAIAEDFPGEEKNLPWLAVFTDGGTEPDRLMRLEEGRQTCLLFEGEKPREHTLTVVKRTENSKGRAGLHRLLLNGEPLPYEAPEPRYRLEFVGDSITCGFGNDMSPQATAFTNGLEDGLAAYPAVTAGLLHAGYQSVCVSGIPLCWASDPSFRLKLPEYPGFTPPPRTMEDYYVCADRNHQEAAGVKEGFEPWDFGRFRPDAVILNLGTNDAYRISVSGGGPAEEAYFRDRYLAFLREVRRLNGLRPVIACTLGPMNYFLYDAIEKAAAAYCRDTGDRRVFCMKFGPIDPSGEGYGGLTHPNLKTHARMGRELAATLEPWLKQEEMS
jgi:hypothetical protein